MVSLGLVKVRVPLPQVDKHSRGELQMVEKDAGPTASGVREPRDGRERTPWGRRPRPRRHGGRRHLARAPAGAGPALDGPSAPRGEGPRGPRGAAAESDRPDSLAALHRCMARSPIRCIMISWVTGMRTDGQIGVVQIIGRRTCS